MIPKLSRLERRRLKDEAEAARVPPTLLLQRRQRKAIKAAFALAPLSVWFCVSVKPRTEYRVGKKVAERICPSGAMLCVYFPERKIYRGRPRGQTGKRREYFESVAGGYVFIGVCLPYVIDTPPTDPAANMAAFEELVPLLRDPDVLSFLGYNGRPAVMCAPVIKRMAQAAGDPSFNSESEDRRAPALAPNTPARIIGGPLHGHVVTVTNIEGNVARFCRTWFGTEIETTIAIENLEAIG